MNRNAYRLEAMELMTLAKLPITTNEVKVLAMDIKAVADEDEDNAFSPDSELAYRGAMELKRRIGGLKNLESYLKCIVISYARKSNG